MSRNERLRLSAAVEKLLDTSKLITLREGVRKSEARRVQDGLELIERPEIEATDRTSTRRMQYQRFLKKVKEVGGPQMVVLCTACLGQSSLALMRERDRLLLPAELKRHSSTYQSDLFSYLAKTYSNGKQEHALGTALPADAIQHRCSLTDSGTLTSRRRLSAHDRRCSKCPNDQGCPRHNTPYEHLQRRDFAVHHCADFERDERTFCSTMSASYVTQNRHTFIFS